MSNHQSPYDIPLLYQALGIPVQMIDTKQIERIPFLARSRGKQIVPVTIDLREVLLVSRVTPSRRRRANVTIGHPIDPAVWDLEEIDGLIAVVKSAIGRHLPTLPDFMALGSKSSMEEFDSLRR